MDYITKEQIKKFIKATRSDSKRVDFAKTEQNDHEDFKTNNPNRIKQKGETPNQKKLDKFIRILNIKFKQNEKETIIKIMPFGLVRCCHSNSAILQHILGDDWEIVLGYNITFCPCGTYISAEIHSVVRHKPTKEFVDFTKDYDGLTHKPFYPLQSVLDSGGVDWFRNKDVLPFIVYKPNAHSCVNNETFSGVDTDEQIEHHILLDDIPENVVISDFDVELDTREVLYNLFIYKLENKNNPNIKINLTANSELEKIRKRGDYETTFNQ